MQLESGRVGGFPCLFWKQAKSTLILKNIALFVCNYGNSHFKCRFKNILEKVVHEVFIEVPLFQDILSRKIPCCTPVTFNLTFLPNFQRNILVFANLPIYRKLIHENISTLCFENQESCVQYYFKGNLNINIRIRNWLVLF